MKARCVNVYAIEEPLFPTLKFDIELEVADLDRPLYCRFSEDKERVRLDFTFDPWRLEKLEELRMGGDLWFRIDLCYCKVRLDGHMEGESYIPIIDEKYGDHIKVARSWWIDELLPRLGLRRVRLIEVPVLEPIPNEFKDVVGYVNEAWKCYLRGDYDDAVANCRRSLIAIAEAVMKMGCEKYEVDEKGEKKPVPDWKEFLIHETLTENFEKVFRGCFGLTQPESHIGRAIPRREAECVIHITYSIVNFILKTIVKAQHV